MRRIYRAVSLSVLAYVLSPSPSSAATPTTLYTFGPSPDGWNPEGPLVVGKNGALYGTTENGGAYGYLGPAYHGYGTVFSLNPPQSSGGAWTKTTLWNFGGTQTDGIYPVGGLVIGPNGTLYGVTAGGGLVGPGTVFSLSPPTLAGGAWSETVLYSFYENASEPSGALVMGPGGTLYGTTLAGGTYGSSCPGPPYGLCGGTVFSLSPPVSMGGSWTETVLWNFGGHQGDGIAPNGIVIGSGGILYGTTEVGGQYYVPPDGGCPNGRYIYCEGTVFSLTPPRSAGAAWAENILWSFGGTASSGSWPNGVIIGGGGVLYGTTQLGSKAGVHGTVFSLSPPASQGGAWTEQDIHGFLGGGLQVSGDVPYGNLFPGQGGVLYGTTFEGGEAGFGTVFVLSPPASPGDLWTLATLWDFESGNGGQCPAAGLVMGRHGVLYGTTSGYNSVAGVASVFGLAP